jgi:hypothetical protein
VVERFFAENFQVIIEEATVLPIAGKDLSSGCLQSLDDLEASYRQKGQRFYKGFVANLTETCNPENELQLITKVQAQPNNVDDPTLLIAALPNLAQRTDLQQLYTDGGYGSPEADQALRVRQVEQIQSAIRGTRLNPDKLHLCSYVIQQDQQGEASQITCPQGHTVPVQPTRSHKSFVARFDPGACADCPFHAEDRCRILWRKRCAKFQMDFTQQEVDAAVRRRRCLENKQATKNLRAAVEAAIRSIKHPFSAGKLPVRGLRRVGDILIGSAAMVNIRRITRYQNAKNNSEPEQDRLESSFSRFQARLLSDWIRLLGGRGPHSVSVCC